MKSSSNKNQVQQISWLTFGLVEPATATRRNEPHHNAKNMFDYDEWRRENRSTFILVHEKIDAKLPYFNCICLDVVEDVAIDTSRSGRTLKKPQQISENLRYFSDATSPKKAKSKQKKNLKANGKQTIMWSLEERKTTILLFPKEIRTWIRVI